jgi:Carbohydrate family 9 binding domain-like
VRCAVIGSALCCLVSVACADRPSPDTAGLSLDALPPDVSLKLDAVIASGVELLGAKLEPEHGLRPGTRVRLTLYWRKTASVAPGVKLFTHVLDGAGERILNLDNIGPLRRASVAGAPAGWQEGKIYVDEQVFTVPRSLRTGDITLVAGLYRDDVRLPVTRGKHSMNRAVIARLPVKRAPSLGAPLPSLTIPRRVAEWSPITVDGKLDEAAWSHAASTGELVHAGSGEPRVGGEVGGSVRLLYDQGSLYLGFDVYDEDVRGGFVREAVDPHLWTRDTVEAMIDPDGDGDNVDYYEIQVGPQNLVFDSHFDSYRHPRTEPDGPFGHQGWSARLKSAVEVRGTLDDGREDDGYVVEMAIPWAAFHRAAQVPPRPGDVWRMNLYAIDSGSAAAWSPVLGEGSFHQASRFGRVRFGR